jgi:hypothetical protein
MSTSQIRRSLRIYRTRQPAQTLLTVGVAVTAVLGIINTPPAPPANMPFEPLISPTFIFWGLLALLSIALLSIFNDWAAALHIVRLWDAGSENHKRDVLKSVLCDFDDKGKAQRLGMTLAEFHAELDSLGLPHNIPIVENVLFPADAYRAQASTYKRHLVVARWFAGGCTVLGALALVLAPGDVFGWLGLGLGLAGVVAATIVLRTL